MRARREEHLPATREEQGEEESPAEDDARVGGAPVITSSERGPGVSFYKGRPGLWAYGLHRITGVAIFLFLLIHIADVAAVGWGREAYNTVHKLYETLFFRLLEVGLFGALLLHAVNGVRIAIVDFWSEGAERQDLLTAWAVFVFIALFVPGAVWMIYNYFAFGR